MKKTILKAAIAASLLAPAVALAEPTVYGNVHVSINDFDTAKNLDMTSNTSSIGVKGSEDLGDGMKAIYKAEFQFDAADGDSAKDGTTGSGNGNALTQRDVWAGLKGGFGSIKLGTMSSNYKQKGGKVDSMYRTRLEGRGFMQTQSRLHGGRATNRGRMTNAVQYASPKFSGIQLVANISISGSDEETTGVGVRWSNKSIMAYADWIDTVGNNATVSPNGTTESAMKVGANYKGDAFFVGGQFEAAEDVTRNDYMHLNGGFNFTKNTSVSLTYGTQTHFNDSLQDTASVAVLLNHKLSKKSKVYAGYGDRSSDTASKEESLFTVGIAKKF